MCSGVPSLCGVYRLNTQAQPGRRSRSKHTYISSLVSTTFTFFSDRGPYGARRYLHSLLDEDGGDSDRWRTVKCQPPLKPMDQAMSTSNIAALVPEYFEEKNYCSSFVRSSVSRLRVLATVGLRGAGRGLVTPHFSQKIEQPRGTDLVSQLDHYRSYYCGTSMVRVIDATEGGSYVVMIAIHVSCQRFKLLSCFRMLSVCLTCLSAVVRKHANSESCWVLFLIPGMKTPSSNCIDTAGDPLWQRLRCNPDSPFLSF